MSRGGADDVDGFGLSRFCQQYRAARWASPVGGGPFVRSVSRVCVKSSDAGAIFVIADESESAAARVRHAIYDGTPLDKQVEGMRR